MTQAANRQWLGGKDREGVLQVLGQNIWGRSALEPLPTSHRLRVSPGPQVVSWVLQWQGPCGHWSFIPMWLGQPLLPVFGHFSLVLNLLLQGMAGVGGLGEASLQGPGSLGIS